MHKDLVLRGAMNGIRARARRVVPEIIRSSLSRSGAVAPVGLSDAVIERHMAICEWLLEIAGGPSGVAGKRVCEIGPGDCRATQLMIAGLGAAGVDVVEPGPRPLGADDQRLLRSLLAHGLLVTPDQAARSSRASKSINTWASYAEVLEVAEQWDLVFSHSVLEHVEDLEGFMRACLRGLKPGGSMHHMIDLSGHGVFEEPLPPLDFQTYPAWLWLLMYPRGQRNTRRHAREYVDAALSVGTTDVVLRPDLTVSSQYMDVMWGRFNRRFRRAGRSDADIVYATLSGRRAHAGALRPA